MEQAARNRYPGFNRLKADTKARVQQMAQSETDIQGLLAELTPLKDNLLLTMRQDFKVLIERLTERQLKLEEELTHLIKRKKFQLEKQSARISLFRENLEIACESADEIGAQFDTRMRGTHGGGGDEGKAGERSN